MLRIQYTAELLYSSLKMRVLIGFVPGTKNISSTSIKSMYLTSNPLWWTPRFYLGMYIQNHAMTVLIVL